MARFRAGVPMKYMISATGITPYNKNVKKAPNTVPLALVASATLIINAT
jgi:hypothetical protein